MIMCILINTFGASIYIFAPGRSLTEECKCADDVLQDSCSDVTVCLRLLS